MGHKLQRLFIICAPGVEPFLKQELESLHLLSENRFRLERGGIEFEGHLIDMMRANLYLRTATRVLIRLGQFYAVGFAELRRKIKKLPWENFLQPDDPVVLRVSCHKSRLYHSAAVAERVVNGIGDCLGTTPRLLPERTLEQSNPPQLIGIRILRNLCTVSVDSSGAALYRRGYRQAIGKAPLRESLAAAMMLASGWDGVSPLVDPFCGSGVIPIEAALMTRQIAPGIKRSFAFMKWGIFEEETWEALRQEAEKKELAEMATIIGSDRDAGAIEAAVANANRAGVAERIQFLCRNVSELTAPGGTGWIVTNPPYGLRTASKKNLRNLYARLGQVARERFSGWHIAMLCHSRALAKQTGFRFQKRLHWENGGIPVELFIGSIG